MLDNVRLFIKELNSRGKLKIAVSYSGGADSGVLLHILVKLYDEGIISKPEVIYFNHNLRGKESDAEEKFTAGICADYGVRLIKISLDVISYAERKGLTIETAARDLRYGQYKLLSGDYDLIAQGHHADDNAETVFFNIMRGAGLDGACGIRKVRDQLIRPLLDFTKKDILSFAKTNGIKFIEDSTNKKTDYSRNKIRNIIFPAIEKELNRNIRNSLNSFSVSAAEAKGFIDETVAKRYSRYVRTFAGLSIIKLSGFNSLNPAIKTAMLHRVMKNTGCIYNPDRIKTDIILNNISGSSNSVFQTDTYSVSVYGDNIFVMNKNSFENPAQISLSEKRRSEYFFDLSCIEGNIIMDKLIQDDVFVPFGKKKGERLSKVLSDKKIPVQLREHLLCLRDENKIIFIQGAGISDTVKTGTDSKDIMYVNIKNDIMKKIF